MAGPDTSGGSSGGDTSGNLNTGGNLNVGPRGKSYTEGGIMYEWDVATQTYIEMGTTTT